MSSSILRTSEIQIKIEFQNNTFAVRNPKPVQYIDYTVLDPKKLHNK